MDKRQALQKFFLLDEEPREALLQLVEKYPALGQAVLEARTRRIGEAIDSCWGRIFREYPRWLALAKTPQKFDRELNKIFSELRAYVKQIYGIEANRPTKNSARDLRIWDLRQKHLAWSLGQIGKEVGLKPTAVAAALQRQQRRRQQQNAAAGIFLEFLADVFKEYYQRYGRNPETKPNPEGPVN
jgi:hypothetical protein